MKKRILALIMSMLLIACTLLTLASCRDDSDDDGDSALPDIDPLDNLGNHDLGGYTVKFAVAESDGDGFNERSIKPDTKSSDRVDSKILARNKYIENRFKCKIDLTYIENGGLVGSRVETDLLGGGVSYDVIAGRQYCDVILCSKGLLVDVLANKVTSKYLDLGREYWGTNYIKGMAYDRQVYWLAGDLNLRYTGGFYATFVNATIYSNYLEDKYGDIHDIVKNGEWTVDKLQAMSDEVSRISADSTPGNLSGNDIVGVAFPIHDNTNGLAVSCGVKYSTTNSKTGKVTFNFTTDNKTLTSFYKEYMELINSKGCMNYFDQEKAGGYVTAFNDFAADRALFVFGRLNQAELYLRNTRDGAFYIVPNPKLNENQENYVSSLHDAINLYGINRNLDDKGLKATAIVLEAMAAESYRSVREEYYTMALGTKYTRSDATKDMIKLISETAYSDFAIVWAHTTYFKGTYGGLGSFLRNAMRNGDDNITSTLSTQGINWSILSMKDIADAFAKIKQ